MIPCRGALHLCDPSVDVSGFAGTFAICGIFLANFLASFFFSSHTGVAPKRKQVHMETDIDRRMVLVHNITGCIQAVKETKTYDDLPDLPWLSLGVGIVS